jgi:hypothetical protein
MTEQHRSRFSGPLLLVVPFALMSAWYLIYAFHGWFQQDDFYFIHLYQHSLHTSDLWTFSDFGRFLSRNAYWHFLWQIFGGQAVYFYLFNFLLIVATTFVIYQTFVVPYDRAVAGTVALIYFGSINVVDDFSWISFSQHLIPIFFVFLFMGMFFDRVDKEWTGSDAFKLLAVLALGISGSVFAAGVLVVPIYFAWRNRELRRDRKFRFFMVLAVLGSLVAIIEAQRFAVGAYATKISWSVVHSNLTYYFQNHLWEYLAALVVMFILGWRRENHFLTSLVLLCAVSFLPYAFLVSQRSQGYMSLTSTTFFMAVVLAGVELFGEIKSVKSLVLVLAVLTQFYFINPSPLNNYWNANPQGAYAHELISQVGAFATAHPELKAYCFENNGDGTGVPQMTKDWAFLSKGLALKDFISPTDKFVFYPQARPPFSSSCQVIVALNTSPLLIIDQQQNK